MPKQHIYSAFFGTLLLVYKALLVQRHSLMIGWWRITFVWQQQENREKTRNTTCHLHVRNILMARGNNQKCWTSSIVVLFFFFNCVSFFSWFCWRGPLCWAAVMSHSLCVWATPLGKRKPHWGLPSKAGMGNWPHMRPRDHTLCMWLIGLLIDFFFFFLIIWWIVDEHSTILSPPFFFF